ncbi:hypothetical protein C3Y87_21200 [Carbonactinospora thermoautotrophica]|nr:hypothetical protein [Carbonactinospora thermoautotrophica]
MASPIGSTAWWWPGSASVTSRPAWSPCWRTSPATSRSCSPPAPAPDPSSPVPTASPAPNATCSPAA